MLSGYTSNTDSYKPTDIPDVTLVVNAIYRYYPQENYDWAGPYFNPYQVTARCSVTDSSSKVSILKGIFHTKMVYHYLATGSQVSNTITELKSIASQSNPTYNYSYPGNMLSIPTDRAFLTSGNGVTTGIGVGYSVTVVKNGASKTYENTVDVTFPGQ